MEIYFLINALYNIYNTHVKLKTAKSIDINKFFELINPFVILENTFSKNMLGGFLIRRGDEKGEDTFVLRYYVRLFLKIMVWISFWCFFGPLGPWVLLTWYTFKRCYKGYKIYFRQY